MFNPEYAHPIELFSAQHLIALASVLAFVLVLFFCRKFFIKYRILDMVLRYSIVAVMLFFELYIMYKNGNGIYSIIGDKFLSSRALCSQLLWLSTIALLSNSGRLMKLIFPLTITGAMMSLIFVDMNCSFPHYRAFQFFLTHAGFLVGSLYFVFTRKINHYTWKDFFNSCLFLFGMSLVSITIGYSSNADPFFIFRAPGPLGFITDTLGQVGYTIVYVVLIFLVQFAIFGITHACTRKRDDNQNYAKVNDNKVIRKLSSFTTKQQILFLFFLTGVAIYNSSLLKRTSSKVLGVFDIILVIAVIFSFVLFEVIANYKKQQQLALDNKETKTLDEKESSNKIEEVEVKETITEEKNN